MPDEAAPPMTTKTRARLSKQSQWFFLGLLFLMLFLTWKVFQPFVIYMVTGAFVAVLAFPIDRLWERIFPNRVAAIMTILSILVLITAPMAGLGWALYKDVSDIAQDINDGKLEEWADQAYGIVDQWFPPQTAQERNQTIDRIVNTTEDRANAFLTAFGQRLLEGLGNFLIAFTVILFVTYYVLTDGDRLVRFLRRAAPLPARQMDYLLREGHRGLRAVFVGQILTSIIQGIVGGIGFFIAGVPGVVLWSAVMAVFSLLPVLGAFLIWLPAGIYLLVIGKVGWGIFLLLYGFIVVSNIDNIVRPLLIGRSTGIHPLFVLVGVLGGVAAFGFIGLFLGPLLVGVTVSVLKVWEEEYLDPLHLQDEPPADGPPPAAPPSEPTS
ncbi:MAG: AI-2E family transporter [Candidatus Thermoplasmatota archaeon]